MIEQPPQRRPPLACWIFDNVLHAGSALHIGAYGQIRIVSTSSYGVIRVCAVMRIQMRGMCPRRGGPAARDKTFRLRSRAIGILINPPLRLHVRCLLPISLLFRTAESVPSNLLFQGSRYVAVEIRGVPFWEFWKIGRMRERGECNEEFDGRFRWNSATIEAHLKKLL